MDLHDVEPIRLRIEDGGAVVVFGRDDTYFISAAFARPTISAALNWVGLKFGARAL